jgi:hypothetical protein
MKAFFNTDKQIVYCTTVEAKKSNPPENFNKCFLDLFPKTKLSDISKRVHFLTFAQLAHKVGVYRPLKKVDTHFLDNACLIMDEVQNLLNPLPSQKQEHSKLEKFLQKDDKPNLKIFILTATPGNNVFDVARLLNLVRDRRHAPILPTIEDIAKKSKGIVQHYDSNSDFTRFPRVFIQPHQECFMSENQTMAYVKAIRSKKKDRTIRKYSNANYMSCHKGKPCSQMLKTYDLKDISCKFKNVIDTLCDSRFAGEKHWVYSEFSENRGFGQGIIGIKNALIDKGFGELLPTDTLENLSNGPRFCVLTTPSLSKHKNGLRKLLDVYNSDANKAGHFCQIMLASNNFKEGVDLKAVRHVHIVEPQTSQASVQQAIGRARRLCSHDQLPYKDWTVKVHTYISEPLGNSFSIEKKTLQQAEDEEVPLLKVYEVLKRASVDAKLF